MAAYEQQISFHTMQTVFAMINGIRGQVVNIDYLAAYINHERIIQYWENYIEEIEDGYQRNQENKERI